MYPADARARRPNNGEIDHLRPVTRGASDEAICDGDRSEGIAAGPSNQSSHPIANDSAICASCQGVAASASQESSPGCARKGGCGCEVRASRSTEDSHYVRDGRAQNASHN